MIRFDQLKRAAAKTLDRTRVRRVFRPNRAGVVEMKQASHRGRVLRNRAGAMMEQTPTQVSRTRLRRTLRRYRVLIIALFAVGALVAFLNGIGGAFHGQWVITPTLSGAPSPRWGMASTFDMTRKETLIFGGQTGGSFSGSAAGHLGDTWGWKESTGRWVNRASPHAPSPRTHSSMVYDDARRVTVLFGGERPGVSGVSNETWTWDGTDWTLRKPPISPPAREMASMAYDAHRKLVVLFGGRGGGVALNDTWTWDGSAWEKLNPPLSPYPRFAAAMEYDVCRAETVLFGGSVTALPPVGTSTVPGPPGETWTWDGKAWEQQFPPTSPTPRFGASMFYATNISRVMLYGGFSITPTHPGPASDEVMWIWDGKEWEPEPTDPVCAVVYSAAVGCNQLVPPPPRGYAAIEYDRTSGRPTTNGSGAENGMAVLLGGTVDPRTGVPHSDQWHWEESAQLGTDSFVHSTVRPFGCSNPIPVPPDEAPVDGQKEEIQLAKTEAREEIQETGRLPVLLGTKFIPGAPEPDCRSSSSSFFDPQVSYSHLATDPKRNKIYQFFACQNAPPPSGSPGKRGVLIQAYDGTTLKPLGSAIMPMPNIVTESSMQWGAGFPNPLHDVERGRFILRYRVAGTDDLWVISQDLVEKGVNPLVNYGGMEGGKFTLPVAGTSNVAFFNHPKTGRPKLLFSTPAATPNPISVVQWDLEANREDWRSPVPSCSAIVPLSVLMRVKDRVYTTCSMGGGWGGVVRISIVEDLTIPAGEKPAGAPELFRGPPLPGNTVTLGDPQAERVLLVTIRNLATELWVFDGKSSRYVGRSGLDIQGKNDAGGYGFDEETGRLYMLVEDRKLYQEITSSSSPVVALGGLRVVDTRLTPVPQAENFGQFSYPTAANISILPPTPGFPRRIFMRRTGGSARRYPDGEQVNLPREMHYLVLADKLPIPEQPELGQLDTLTIPVPESAGKTEVSFDAEGSGYGIRLRSLGGIASAARSPYSVSSNDYHRIFIEEIPQRSISDTNLGPPCYYPDRELLAGWVSNVHLSNLETSAHSSGLNVDSNSKSDLAGPSTKCIPPRVSPSTFPAALSVLWPLLPFAQTDAVAGQNLVWDNHFKETECVGDSSQANEAKLGDLTVAPSALVPSGVTVPQGVPTDTVTAPTGGKIPIGGIITSTTCNQKGFSAQGISRAALGGSAVTATFSVGEGYSNVAVGREPGRGMVVTSTAEATGIKLPGISIGYVKTEAVAWSNGRPSAPDKPRATFTRTICGVTSTVFASPGCLNEDQQKQMVAGFNQLMGFNGKMSLPTPDPDFYRGSPGGYIAGVIKPLAEEIEDQYFARDYQKEVSGLQIVINKDSFQFGEGRQVLQLAAVRAVAGFGVQCSFDFVYSAAAKNCVALTFEGDPVEFEEEELSDEGAFNSYEDDSEGGWTQVEAIGPPEGLALGKRIGRFIQNLPVIRQLPIRQMGEALLAGSVWMLLGMPLFLASRRFALNLARKS